MQSGTYTKVVTGEETTLHRVYAGGADPLGSYWMRKPPAEPPQLKVDRALDPACGNTAQSVAIIRVPAGTTIYEDSATAQSGSVGGSSEIYIPKVNPNWLVSKESRMSLTGIVQRWFKDEWGGSLMLPDGWFGRPYDSQHVLASIEESGDTLTMVLDQNLVFRFKGLTSVRPGNHELVFGPFDRLLFEWGAYDGGKPLTKEYQGGEIKIVSAPG